MPNNAPYVLDPYNAFGGASLAPLDSSLLTSARQRLVAQANPQAAQTGSAMPNQDEYAIFGPQYAAALSRPTDSASEHILNTALLRQGAEGERGAYEAALRRAQLGATQLEDQRGYYGLAEANAAHDPTRYISGATTTAIDPATGRATTVRDPVATRVDNQMRLNAAQAGVRKDNAAATYDFYRSGIRTPVETIEGQNTPPTQEQPDQYNVFGSSGYGPSDQNNAEELPIKQLQAQAAMQGANAQMYHAQHPDEHQTVTYQYMPGADQPIITQRGPPGAFNGQRPGPGGPPQQGGPTPQQQTRMSAVQSHGAQAQMSGNILVVVHEGRTYMYGPDGEPITQGGAPPGQVRGGAHPAAFSLNGAAGTRDFSSPTRIREHGTPIHNADQVVTELFPGVHINQTIRDPNSALGRANPNSWHNRSTPTFRPVVDMRPMPGMSFQQAAQTIRQQGYRIIEGRDEVHDPSPHATGPHWHFVLGRG